MGHVVIGCFHQKCNNFFTVVWGVYLVAKNRFLIFEYRKSYIQNGILIDRNDFKFFYSCSFRKYSKIENAKTKKAAIFNTFGARHVMTIQFEIYLIWNCPI